MSQRTAIRYYLKDMLVDADLVGNRVFLNRPESVFVEELPSICVYFESEPIEGWTGSEDNPDEYRRNLAVNIDIMVEDPLLESGHSPGEDMADILGDEIEEIMFEDHTFVKRLDDYNANTNYSHGLLMGMNLQNVIPFKVETDGDRRIVGQRLQFNLPYQKSATRRIKYDDFKEYYMAVIRVDSNEETVDRELIEAQGELNNGE